MMETRGGREMTTKPQSLTLSGTLWLASQSSATVPVSFRPNWRCFSKTGVLPLERRHFRFSPAERTFWRALRKHETGLAG